MAGKTKVTAGPAPERPENVIELLSEDVSYRGWEKESASRPRFYLRGVTWLLRTYGTLDVSNFKQYFEPAVELIKNETEWSSQLLASPQDRKAYASGWDEKPSYNQALRAFNSRDAVVFFKAVQFIAISEVALRDVATKGVDVDPLEVYSRMSIQPACFNVDDFNTNRLTRLRTNVNDFDRRALEACDQSNPKMLDQLATGYTVTRQTAEKLKDFIDGNDETDEVVGKVRYQSGKQSLGKKRASSFELVSG